MGSLLRCVITVVAALGLENIAVVATKDAVLVAPMDKAEAVRDTVVGPVTPEVPASILQRHSAATLFLDSPAAARLPR